MRMIIDRLWFIGLILVLALIGTTKVDSVESVLAIVDVVWIIAIIVH